MDPKDSRRTWPFWKVDYLPSYGVCRIYGFDVERYSKVSDLFAEFLWTLETILGEVNEDGQREETVKLLISVYKAHNIAIIGPSGAVQTVSYSRRPLFCIFFFSSCFLVVAAVAKSQ